MSGPMIHGEPAVCPSNGREATPVPFETALEHTLKEHDETLRRLGTDDTTE
jgi:hypothetical protein